VINEAQALALLDEVNPVPDLESYEVEAAEVTPQLTTLVQRSSEMTQLDTRRANVSPRPKQPTFWVAAAVVIVLIGAVALLLSQTREVAPAAPVAPIPHSSSSTMSTEGVDISQLVDVNDWIAYQGPGPDGTAFVFLVHPGGTERHKIGEEVGASGLPDWSPDGTSVIFTTRGGVTEPLYSYDLATETSSEVFACEDPCVADDEPSYSADGSQIVFTRYFGPIVNDLPSDCGLWIGNVDTKQVTQITSNPGCDKEYAPRLSPDGTTIAYHRYDENGFGKRTAVFLIDVAGGDETQLTDWSISAAEPVWSPDGEWLVVSFDPEGIDRSGSDLHRMRPDGSEVEQLTFYETVVRRPYHPRYTPDGEWIVYSLHSSAGTELWMIPAEGGNPVALVTGGHFVHPAWQPTP